MVNEFEPLLLTCQKGGLTRVGQPLYMRARNPVQWQRMTMYTKMKAQHTEPGSDPKNYENRGLERNLAMMKYGKSVAIRSHVSYPASNRRAPNIDQALNVASYNIRTLADTNRETNRGILHIKISI